MKQLSLWFKNRYTPLQQLLIMGFLLRLVSVIFSKGFGWHDDHFLIIESAQNWADGYTNNWLPSPDDPSREPQGHALFYPGIHYLIFKFFNIIGVVNPQVKMFFVRLLHALWSLLMIKYSYKIAEQYANKKVAWYVGLFMTFYWFMPFMSVRNLVEFVCVPALLIAIYRLGKPQTDWKDFLVAGLWLGLAFSVRFQSLFVTAGIGLALLIYKKPWKHIFILIGLFSAVVLLTQGITDYIIWKKPFAEFMGYVEYNVNNATAYGTDNWHMYFDLIFGLLIPPLSFLLFWGYFYSWKKMPLLFWPVLLFLAFHTYFPNKQERFIMTVLPLMIISGTVGMFMIYEKYKEKFNPKLFRFSKIFVIALISISLPILSTSYSKRHRVEAMMYLYHHDTGKNLFVEDSNKYDDYLMPALFYYGKGRWPSVCAINQVKPVDSALVYYNHLPPDMKPKYMIFWEAKKIEERVANTKKYFPKLQLETTIEPSFIDKTLFWLNPLNDNQTAYIYRIE